MQTLSMKYLQTEFRNILKIIYHDQSGFIIHKSVNVLYIYNTNSFKDRNHIIFSTDADK